MIKSMTGFGRGSVKSKGGQINVEVQSLNSRYIDLRFFGFNLSPEAEDNFRRIISSNLQRGSIKVYIEIDNIDAYIEDAIELSRLSDYKIPCINIFTLFQK